LLERRARPARPQRSAKRHRRHLGATERIESHAKRAAIERTGSDAERAAIELFYRRFAFGRLCDSGNRDVRR
jgi:hypothetical protein